MLDKLVSRDFAARREASLPPTFDCSLTNGHAGRSCVHVAGELDVATAPQLDSTLRELSRSPLVVVDLRELTFMSSSGVHAIVDASVRARQGGGRVVVRRGPPNVDRMFTLAGIADDVEVGEVGEVDVAAPRAASPRVPDAESESEH